MIGNPKSCDWGDICWGHFISQDGIHWQHNSLDPVLEPQLPYDNQGIFTGCMHPTGPYGEPDKLTLIYSSINHLPIHWTLPHKRDCAGLALAVSNDAGHTWHKSDLNPILNGEPEGLIVTGFRDPYLAEWPALDQLRNVAEKRLYGVISGGVVDQGPAVFLYEVSPNDLTTWTYIGPLADLPLGFRRPSHWNGDYGVNWECVNFMTLGDGTREYDMLTMGTEGGFSREYKQEQGGEQDKPTHGTWALWMGLSIQGTASEAMSYDFGGILDNGDLYGPNSYKHPQTGQRVLWGWIKEEDLSLTRRESKGWTGYLSLPRELFLLCIPDTVRALKTPLEDIPSIKLLGDADEKHQSVYTLGIRPLPILKSLRPKTSETWSNISTSTRKPHQLTQTQSNNWELEAELKIHPGIRSVGFHVRHDESLYNTTTIYFAVEDEEIVVDKRSSNHEVDMKKNRLRGPFTLFVSEDNGTEVTENLRLRIFSDGDVLEIFANDRFALSTTVYVDALSCLGISCFTEGDTEDAGTFETIELWEGLQSVMAQR